MHSTTGISASYKPTSVFIELKAGQTVGDIVLKVGAKKIEDAVHSAEVGTMLFYNGDSSTLSTA